MLGRLIKCIGLGCALGTATPPLAQRSASARVVLLGTGAGPTARSDRSQPASLLQIGAKTYLIDAGEGVLSQLAKANVQPRSIDAIFITHLHFAHTGGLPALLAFIRQDRRTSPLTVYGPPGSERLLHHSIGTFQSGADLFRAEQPDLPPFTSLFLGHDIAIDRATEMYRDGVVRITAVSNSHYSTMQPLLRSYGGARSYSYRIDTKTDAIVFTGDTGPSKAVEELSRGADVLISEVIDLDAIVARLRKRAKVSSSDQSELIAHMKKEHLTPEEVGDLGKRAGVKRIFLTHIASPPGIAADAPALVVRVKTRFSGDVVAGSDLYSF